MYSGVADGGTGDLGYMPTGSPDLTNGQCADGGADAAEFPGQSFATYYNSINPHKGLFSLSLGFKTSGDGPLVVAHGNGEGISLEVDEMSDHVVVEIVDGKVHFDSFLWSYVIISILYFRRNFLF